MIYSRFYSDKIEYLKPPDAYPAINLGILLNNTMPILLAQEIENQAVFLNSFYFANSILQRTIKRKDRQKETILAFLVRARIAIKKETKQAEGGVVPKLLYSA